MQTTSLLQIIIFSFAGGVLSLIGGVVLLAGPKKHLQTFTKLAVPFAAGALLGAVFLDLLVDGVETANPETVFVSALIGVVLFFLLERVTHWFHHHHEEDNKKAKSKSVVLIILADTLHNALDGVAIASAFLISVPTGIVTTFAVAAHEIPQEIGDFGLLLAKGMSRGRVLLVNVLSALSTVLFATITYLLGGEDKLPLGALLGLSAGFLLYIAMSDIIPTLHESKAKKGRLDTNAILLILGVLTVGIAVKLAHHYIDG